MSTSAIVSPLPTFGANRLRGVHHIALHVQDMERSRHFYGQILGLHELIGEEVPETLKQAVAAGEVANFQLPDRTILDLFWKPNLLPPDPD
ncbi:MAG: VOC family protein, partial [Cyanothece sp. SIO2G6]|nr:VOC family protein [Cyanothece sp. SIO2G6]